MVLVLWLLFAGSHALLSSARVRPRLVGSLGEGRFLALYSLVAFATFGALVGYYFAHKHAGPLLWSVPLGAPGRWLLYLLMAVAFILIAAGLVAPSPASVGRGAGTEPRGAHFVTRHPLFMGVGLWGALHLVPNGFLSDVVFFAGFPLFALIGCWHQDARKLSTAGDGFRSFYERTPFVPFTGRETVRGLREMPPLAIAAGVALTVVLRMFHDALFA